MAISHNPILNSAVSTELSQAQIDARFEELTKNPPMTIEGTVSKVFLSFLAVAATVAAVWIIEPIRNLAIAGFIPLVLVGLGIGLYNSFAKKVGAASVIAYSVVEGAVIAALSFMIDALYPGLPMQAVLATLATAGAMFAAYRFGWVKVTPGFSKVMLFALIGYAAFGLINFITAMINPALNAYNTPFAWVIALIGVGLAAFTLNLDFAAIEQGAAQRAPQALEWRFAFGLVSSLIWLYIEILRLLTILNRD